MKGAIFFIIFFFLIETFIFGSHTILEGSGSGSGEASGLGSNKVSLMNPEGSGADNIDKFKDSPLKFLAEEQFLSYNDKIAETSTTTTTTTTESKFSYIFFFLN